MKKKKLGVLIFSMLFALIFVVSSTTSLAQDISLLKENYREIKPSEIKQALQDNSNSKIVVNEENRKEVYEQLGLTKIMEEKNKRLSSDNGKVIKEEFYIKSTQPKLSDKFSTQTPDEEHLPDYKGVPMKIVYQDRLVQYDKEIIYGGKSLKEKIIESTLSKSVSIVLGFLKPWVWIPDVVLGLTSSWFENNCTYGTTLSGEIDKGELGKYIFVKDVDDRISGHDWYGFCAVEKANFRCKVILDYIDQNSMPQEIESVTRHTTQTPKYDDHDFLQKEAYDVYKEEPGAMGYFEFVPKPDIPNYD